MDGAGLLRVIVAAAVARLNQALLDQGCELAYQGVSSIVTMALRVRRADAPAAQHLDWPQPLFTAERLILTRITGKAGFERVWETPLRAR